MPENNSTVDNAIRLVVAGAVVFPVRLAINDKGKKVPAFPGPWNEYQMTAATAQEIEQARAYGIDCGRSNVIVVDLDAKDEANGVTLWRDRDLPRSPFVVRTQAGGEHHWFRAPDGEPVGNASFPTLGVDVRGAGGLVFGPGSTVEGGGSYALETALPASFADLPEYPAAVVEALREEDKANKRTRAAERRPEAFTPAPAGADIVEQCEHRVREQLAILEESVTGGFNDELNRLVGMVGQWYRAQGDTDGEQYTVEDIRAHVVQLCEDSPVIGPLDATDWGTINGTGAQWGLDNPYTPGGPSSAELDWSDMIQVEATPTQPAPAADPLAELYGSAEKDQPGQTPDGPPRSRLWNTLLSTELLKGDPPPTPPYVLDGLLREGELAALVSAAKAGKSLLTFERVLQAVRDGRRVLYMDAENGLYDIHTRVADLGYGGDDADLSGLIYSNFPPTTLDSAADARDFLQFVAELTVAYGKIDAAIFDTASRFLEGAENDAEPWLAMYRLALQPLKRAGIAVLRLDHLGKDETKGARGSSAKNGDVDTVWELKADDPPHGQRVPVRVELKCAMQRSGTHARFTVLCRDVVDGVLTHRPDGSLDEGQAMPTAAPARVDPADEVVAILDRAGCPDDAGRRAAQEWLRDRGVTLPRENAAWAEAIRRRKGRSPRVAIAANAVTPRDEDLSAKRSATMIDNLSADRGPGQPRTTADNRGQLPVFAGQSGPELADKRSCTEATGTVVRTEGLSIGQPSADSLEIDHEDNPASGDETEEVPPAPPPPAKRTKLTDEERAERKAAQAEARRQAAAEKRALALAEASGPRVELPATVDRAGTIRPVSLGDAMHAVSAALERSGALTVDVETSGRPLGHRDYALRTVQLGDALEAVVFDATQHAAAIKTLLGEADRLHAFSASADLVPLIAAGLAGESIWSRMYDVVIPAKLADPQSTGADAEGLKDLARGVLGELSTAPAAEAAKNTMFKAGGWLVKVKHDTPLERNGWANVDSACSTMVRYAASDVLDTAALALKLPWPQSDQLERERTVEEMTSRVTYRGIRLDPEQVARLRDEHTANLQDATERVQRGGVQSPGSDKELAAKLTELKLQLPRTKPTERFPEGQPSVAKDVLEALGRTEGPWSDLLTAVLDYRKSETALGLFIEPYWDLIQNGDGRARPTIYTLAADTGRMSGARPNPQQIPQTGGFRACWVPDPGFLGIGADFSSVELRVAAGLSQDPSLLRYIHEEDNATEEERKHGVGLHWAIAREVWGTEATKLDRYRAKRIVFGRLYGGGVPTLAKQAGVTEGIAASAVDIIDELAPGLARWSEETRQAVRRGQTQFPIYSGAAVHVDPAFPHKAPNYRIQRTARELLVDAMLRWRDTRWGACTLLPVHDQLVVMVPEAEAQEATAELVRCMETELFGVQIKVDADEPWTAWPDVD